MSVPRSALRPDGSLLIVDAEERLQRRPVEVIRIDRDHALVRGDLMAGELKSHRAGSLENVHPRVGGQKRVGDRRPLVVPWHHDHRDSLGHLHQGLEGTVDQLPPHLATEQQVAAMHHEVDLAATGGCQRPLEAGEEVRAAAAAFHPGP